MQTSNTLPVRTAVAAVLAAALIARAGETKIWTTAEQSELVKGTLKNLSVRSDGRLTLAPAIREVLDASAPFLWALVEDSKGNIYAGGGGLSGAPLKLHRIDPTGKVSVYSELEGLAIHALAVDRQDRVYAATSPDGKVYRISSAGKPEVFYDPKCKYIWAIIFNAQGELFVGTGDQGQIHRVAPAGKGGIFFDTEEVHARSLAIDATGNLIVGTEPSALILRVTPAGEGFVLHQAAKREVTAVAVAPDGSIYAAAAGNKTAATVSSAPSPPSAPAAPVPSQGPMGVALQPRAAAAPPATIATPGPSLTGGSEVYKIHPDGYPSKVWSDAQEIVYALGFDAQGRPLIGTGNKGVIHRLDSDVQSTLLASVSPTQITAFSVAKRGRLFAATGNIGKVFQIGPGLESEGTLESEAFDTLLFSQWGRLSFEGDARGGKVVCETRSGNLDRPQKNWSPWAPVDLAGVSRIGSPSARFLQWRLRLTAAADGRSPEVSSVDVAYLTRNVAPVVERIEATPPNYRFPPQNLTLTPSSNLTLPAFGQQRRRSPATPALSDSSVSMQYAKGFVGARWQASDPNGDSLTYRVDIRGAGETEWKLLKDKVREKNISWDSISFPDGEYRIRVTASDSPSNPPDHALAGSAESESFLIDNTAPRISGLSASLAGLRLTAKWKAADARSTLDKAEYSINGGDWTPVEPTTRLSDSAEHDYELAVDGVPPGEITVAVRVTDAWDNHAVEKTVVKR